MKFAPRSQSYEGLDTPDVHANIQHLLQNLVRIKPGIGKSFDLKNSVPRMQADQLIEQF